MRTEAIEGNGIIELVTTISKKACLQLQESNEETKEVIDQLNEQIENLFQQNERRITRAFEAITEFVQMHKSFDEPIDLLKVIDTLENANIKAHNLARDTEHVLEKITESKGIAPTLNINEEAFHALHQIAYLFYEEEEYLKSHDIFWLLTNLDALEETYWIGLGLSAYQLERWDEALQFLDFAIAINAENPLPYYYAASIHKNRMEEMEAGNLIEQCIENCGTKKEWKELLHQANQLKQNIK